MKPESSSDLVTILAPVTLLVERRRGVAERGPAHGDVEEIKTKRQANALQTICSLHWFFSLSVFYCHLPVLHVTPSGALGSFLCPDHSSQT